MRQFSIERYNSPKSIEKHSKRNETSNMLQRKVIKEIIYEEIAKLEYHFKR